MVNKMNYIMFSFFHTVSVSGVLLLVSPSFSSQLYLGGHVDSPAVLSATKLINTVDSVELFVINCLSPTLLLYESSS